MNIARNQKNIVGFNILNPISINQVLDIQKAYIEGVYADTSQNRKLGRVGQKYSETLNGNEGVLMEKMRQHPEFKNLSDDSLRYLIKESKKKPKSKEEIAFDSFKSIFETLYITREGKFSVEEWDKFEKELSRLPEKWLKEAGKIKGLSYLVNKILSKKE